MIAHKIEYKERPQFTVVPATAEHAEAIQNLAGAAYHIDAELAKDWFAAEQYKSRIAHFAEGQFIALDNDQVVGMTSSMRFQYSGESTFLEEWDRTSGYG
ncbi:MAG: hypothetical protein ABI835_08415 [Chloroflexota bacterium]